MNIESTINEPMFNYAQELGYGDLHFKMDKKTGLFAIIAIHNTNLGPSLGGCRFLSYTTVNSAVRDVLRLARGMSYKSAVIGLPLGGGKSVVVKPKNLSASARIAMFEKFGEFIDELGGRYITAMDSGTNTEDMDAIAKTSKNVCSTSSGYGDPSPFTAEGVFSSIQAAVKFKLNHNSLDGIKVAIQGVGHVGISLAKLLHEAGAKLIVTDTNPLAVEKCVKEFKATAVGLDEIYGVNCDVFSPCALGATINDQTIPQLKAKIVVGSANNQLAEHSHGDELHKLGILYGPDYVVNAGGVVCAWADFYKIPLDAVRSKVQSIYQTTMTIFERSAIENVATHSIADKIAEEKLNAHSSIQEAA